MMDFLNACRRFGSGLFDGRFDQGDRFDRFRTMFPGHWLIGLLVAALVVVGIVLLVRALVRSSQKGHSSSAVNDMTAANNSKPLQILDERLARGEIDTEEYRRRKDELLKP